MEFLFRFLGIKKVHSPADRDEKYGTKKVQLNQELIGPFKANYSTEFIQIKFRKISFNT